MSDFSGQAARGASPFTPLALPTGQLTFPRNSHYDLTTKRGQVNCPKDWHDLAGNHDFSGDEAMCRSSIERGLYLFPSATEQCSISFAHTQHDTEVTLEQVEKVLSQSPR